jgi:hypothetical protein
MGILVSLAIGMFVHASCALQCACSAAGAPSIEAGRIRRMHIRRPQNILKR